MPGTIVFKPLEANIPIKAHLKDQFNSFCSFSIGDQKIQNQPSDKGGKYPHWNDSVTLMVFDQPTCNMELRAEDAPSLGSCEIDLEEIESQGRVTKWYHVKNQDEFGGEVLLEAIYTPDDTVKNTKMIQIGTKPKRAADKVPETKPIRAEIDPELVRQEKASQGYIPDFIDPDRIIQERSKWEMDPVNSHARIAETNEFGDYQPHKQLPMGDMRHEYGSGMMQQGSYYSGQQTSYGEAYPMVHKSVKSDQIHYDNPADWISDRTNPFDYARYQQQAFLPQRTPLSDEQPRNMSVIEKALHNSQLESRRKQSGNFLQAGKLDDLERAETQYSDLNPSNAPENEPQRTNVYVKDKEFQNHEMLSANGGNLLHKERPSTASTTWTYTSTPSMEQF